LAWKVPGLDDLPVGFLRVCGKPLAEIIAIIITACFTLEYFPQRFRCAEVVILAKPEKTDKIVHMSDTYKSITLLSVINKIIEKIMNNRIIAAVEKHNLLS
jgi:hypothetical protein